MTSLTAPTPSAIDEADSALPTTDHPTPRHGNGPSRARPVRLASIWLLALGAVVMILTTACTLPGTGGETIDSGVVVPTSPSEPGTSTPVEGAESVDPIWVQASTRAVVTDGSVEVYAAPGGAPMLTLTPTTSFGTTRVLLVEEERNGWLKVRLPIRPNHQTGWIPADRVSVEDVDLAVHIDLQTRTLTVGDGDVALLSTPVAIGTTEHPTPVGTFYITDKLATPDPDGAYGPFAFGLSGYSETLTEFAGGDGQIGIHGTNDPTSIGREASHGCIRVPNAIVEDLADLLPLGTPVHIV